MNDLDETLRSVARALVEDAPPPPAFDSASVAAVSPRGSARPLIWAAVAIVVSGAAVVSVAHTRHEAVPVNAADGPRDSHSNACGADPAVRVTVPGSTGGPTPGAAPGQRRLQPGQRAEYWSLADGVVELRWPAAPPRVYDDGTTPVSTLFVSEAIVGGRDQIDVHSPRDMSDPTVAEPDVIVERAEEGVAEPTESCRTLELTIENAQGLWFGGLRSTAADEQRETPVEFVDLRPLVISRQSVDNAPDTAITCEGSDRNGTPPNRSGGRDAAITGPQPVDVLQQYLANTPGAPPRGYVEMTEPSGSITYAVDASGTGWTTLVFVARAGDRWYLDGWNSSGC
jgi:hypothetical protein